MPEFIFDERIARRYDAVSADMFSPAVLEPTVELLAELAGGGAVLELGIGTGRVALPLSKRGVDVHGIELSPAMVDQLRTKEGAEAIGVTIGDFATVTVGRTFSLAYLVFNTITNLLTQDEQVACFRNVAAHLEPCGRFVIEVSVPELQRLPFGETILPFAASSTQVDFDRFDVVDQTLVSHHYWFEGDSVEMFFSPHRYVWPSELDLMARLAGLTLSERWGGWSREPFTATSTSHVSVWRKP